MSSGQITVLAAAVVTAVLVLVVLLTVLTSTRRARRRTDAALVAARAEIAALRERLDALTAQPPVRRRPADPDFVITTAGTRRADEVDRHPPPPVEVRQFASVALGESLVRLVSLGYGVRRALSAENRNRIAFEMRREVRRSRKDRRRELRDLRRRLREEPGQRPGPESGQEHAA
ncbi:MAG: hypothetical protein ACLGH4_02690 [Actinomycetes bacterium]